jgi:hypothetical protein
VPSGQHQTSRTHTTFIIVKETREISKGRNPRTQDEFVLWQVIATKPDGTPIPQNLRCFEELPRGEVLEVSVTPFVSEQWGTSYTIARKDKSRLHTEVHTLEERVARIERHLGLGDNDSPPPSSPPPAPPAVPPPLSPTPDTTVPPPPDLQRPKPSEGDVPF